MSTTTINQAIRRGTEAGGRYVLTIPREAGTQMAGSRTGLRPGRSLDFRDYRGYEPGDDLRQVDWNVYARTDQLTVKLFQEEVCPHVDLLVDTSRSMALADTAKAEATAGLTAMLVSAAVQARFTVSVWVSWGAFIKKMEGDPLRPDTWAFPEFDGTIPLADLLRVNPPSFKRRGIRFLISDLFWPAEPSEILRRVGDGATAIHVLQVMGKADWELPDHGFIRIVDSETDEEMDLFMDEAARQKYQRAFQNHQALWADACRKTHATLNVITAENFVQCWTLDTLLRSGILEGA